MQEVPKRVRRREVGVVDRRRRPVVALGRLIVERARKQKPAIQRRRPRVTTSPRQSHLDVGHQSFRRPPSPASGRRPGRADRRSHDVGDRRETSRRRSSGSGRPDGGPGEAAGHLPATGRRHRVLVEVGGDRSRLGRGRRRRDGVADLLAQRDADEGDEHGEGERERVDEPRDDHTRRHARPPRGDRRLPPRLNGRRRRRRRRRRRQPSGGGGTLAVRRQSAAAGAQCASNSASDLRQSKQLAEQRDDGQRDRRRQKNGDTERRQIDVQITGVDVVRTFRRIVRCRRPPLRVGRTPPIKPRPHQESTGVFPVVENALENAVVGRRPCDVSVAARQGEGQRERRRTRDENVVVGERLVRRRRRPDVDFHVDVARTVAHLTCIVKRNQSSVKPRLHDTTCCQTGCQTGLTTGCIVYTAGCQIGCTTRFDNR